MTRPKIPKKTETEVLTKSKRKCCLCVGLEGNYSTRYYGQIAHLDHDNSNNKFDNLAWLCLEHHAMYDTTSSQHKNITLNEIKHHRNSLYNFLEAHPNIDRPNTERVDKTKPYCLLLDGISSCIRLYNKELYQINTLTLESLFKIFNAKYTGILLSLDHPENDSFYCIMYYSNEHKHYPGELHLKYVHLSKNINDSLASITIDPQEWEKLRLTISKDKFDLKVGNQRVSTFCRHSDFKFDTIQIGGRIEPNNTGCFVACYMSYFKAFDTDKDQIIRDLIFDYGEEYLLALPKIEGITLINSPEFYKMPK